MALNQPFEVTGFHSCDISTGLRVLNGKMQLKPSANKWDWLGGGIYFWEQNPARALQYAIESSQGNQFNRIPIKTPFVIGAIIELGNCLNLTETDSLSILHEAYYNLLQVVKEAGKEMPVNKNNNRALDCAVIQFIHQSNKQAGKEPFDTIRCAFPEGGEVFPGSSITSRQHIQVCVINPEKIKGYFLPRPLNKFNPCFK